jgi:hypothetical protein
VASSLVERPYTDAYLLAYSDEHVFYECDMFLWLAQVCGGGAKLGAPSVPDATRLNNVLIEAFVIHLRNVVDFLYLDRPKKTDVVAADFCTASSWAATRPAISAALDAARTRANKEIAHLTTDRLAARSPAKQWEFSVLAAEIRPLLQLFAKCAVPGRLSGRAAAVIG